MPFCQHCGTEMPDEARFCSSCGRPLADPAAGGGPQQRDSCEIVSVWLSEKWGILPSDYLQFRAMATGPSGGYEAGESVRIKAGLADYYGPNVKNKEHVKALTGLVDELGREGWEKAGRGEAWYSLKFTRPSKL